MINKWVNKFYVTNPIMFNPIPPFWHHWTPTALKHSAYSFLPGSKSTDIFKNTSNMLTARHVLFRIFIKVLIKSFFFLVENITKFSSPKIFLKISFETGLREFEKLISTYGTFGTLLWFKYLKIDSFLYFEFK